MAGKREIRCVGPSAQLADRGASCQRTVNMYLERVEGLGEARPLILASAPGMVKVYGVLSTVLRGSRNVGDSVYFVDGDTLYSMVLPSGATTAIGTLATNTGYVGITHSATEVAAVDGNNLYVVNLATLAMQTITLASDPAWLGSYDVQELDGYAIFVRPDSDQFYWSDIDDFSSLDALNFSSADSIPDNIVTHRVFNRELWLFGRRSTEIWVDSGGDPPFTRYSSAPIPIGVVGRRAAIVTTDRIFWIGQGDHGAGIVYSTGAHTPQRVSTTPVEEALSALPNLASAKMWTYQSSGHEFVGISADDLDTTWVYDIATQEWHERALISNGEWQPLDIDNVVFFGGEHYTFGADGLGSGAIYQLDAETYDYGVTATDNNTARILVRERTWPHLVSPSLEPVNYRGLELACSKGNGGTVTLEISNDGGEVFGSPLQRSLGATGRRTERVRWQGLGSAHDRVFRIRCSDAVAFNIHDASVDAG